ncbi:MAG: hypothetical protein NC935_03085, partial [Candidatus Omnitrophica bacterium]|nr:hypothetical protein [Candidatus Omnitrophota bacterium]
MGYKEHFIISLAFTGITTLILGIFVYFRNRHNKINTTFALYSISIAWWSLTQIGNVYGPSLETSWFWAKIEQSGVVFIPTFFVHFIIVLLGLKKKWLLRFCYIFSTIIAILSPTTSLISPRAERKFGIINFGEPGPLYPLLIIFFVFCVVYSLRKLLLAYKESTGARRNQLKYLLWSSVIGYIGGGANFLLVYDISIYPLNPFGTYFVGLYTFAVTYAILKYRLLDIKIVLTRAGIFFLVYLFVLGIPFGLAAWGRLWFTKIFGQNWWIIPLSLMAVLATSGIFIFNHLRRQAENRLLAERLKRYDKLKRFAKTLGLLRDIELERLVKLIVYRLVKTLEISFGAIYLYEKEEKSCFLKAGFTLKGPHPLLEKEILQENDFIKFILNYRKEFLLEDVQKLSLEPKSNKNNSNISDISFLKVISYMQESKIQLVIPHFLEESLVGFLVLGPPISESSYSESDLETLRILSGSVGLAILNAIFMHELKKTQLELAESSRIAQIGY